MSLYNLHIPRSGGIYIKNHVVPHLTSRGFTSLASNHGQLTPESFLNKSFISGHYGTSPSFYRGDLWEFTVLRNPVDRYISNYLYVTETPTDESFEAWVNSDVQANLQTKFLTQNLNLDIYNAATGDLARSNLGWCLEGGPEDLQGAKDRIDAMVLVGFMEDFNEFLDNLNHLLEFKYGFTTFNNRNLINSNTNKLNLTASILRKVEEINHLDVELYEYARAKA